jgi:hypothetical protein
MRIGLLQDRLCAESLPKISSHGDTAIERIRLKGNGVIVVIANSGKRQVILTQADDESPIVATGSLLHVLYVILGNAQHAEQGKNHCHNSQDYIGDTVVHLHFNCKDKYYY